MMTEHDSELRWLTLHLVPYAAPPLQKVPSGRVTCWMISGKCR